MTGRKVAPLVRRGEAALMEEVASLRAALAAAETRAADMEQRAVRHEDERNQERMRAEEAERQRDNLKALNLSVDCISRGCLEMQAATRAAEIGTIEDLGEQLTALRSLLGRVVEALRNAHEVLTARLGGSLSQEEWDSAFHDSVGEMSELLSDPTLSALAEQAKKERAVVEAAQEVVFYLSKSGSNLPAYCDLADAVRALAPSDGR